MHDKDSWQWGRAAAVWALALGVALSGCGAKPTVVTGKVTLDGQSLERGTISFRAEDGQTPTAGVGVENGTYSVPAAPGKKRVMISATKVIGKRQVYQGDPNSPVVDEVQEIIPPQDNAQTTLTADLVAGPNMCDFALRSKP